MIIPLLFRKILSKVLKENDRRVWKAALSSPGRPMPNGLGCSLGLTCEVFRASQAAGQNSELGLGDERDSRSL